MFIFLHDWGAGGKEWRGIEGKKYVTQLYETQLQPINKALLKHKHSFVYILFMVAFVQKWQT